MSDTTPQGEAVLLPCPFCGEAAEIDTQRYFASLGDGRRRKSTAVYCQNCPADLELCHDDTPDLSADDRVEIVTRMWNTRAALAPPNAAIPSAEPGYVMAPHFRGYAALGEGGYLLVDSDAGEPPELIIYPATAEEAAGRVVGEMKDITPGEVIPAERMAIRLRFLNEAGLRAFDQQMANLRKVHFPNYVYAAPPNVQSGDSGAKNV